MWTDNVPGVAGLPGDAAWVVTNQGEPVGAPHIVKPSDYFEGLD